MQRIRKMKMSLPLFLTVAGLLTMSPGTEAQWTFEGQLEKLQDFAKLSRTLKDELRQAARAVPLDIIDISRRDFLKKTEELFATEPFNSNIRHKDSDKTINTSHISMNKDNPLYFQSSVNGANDFKNYKHLELLGSDNSSQCYQDSEAAVTSAIYKVFWALEMIDAVGKPGPGVFTGRLKWPGYYEQCLAINANYTKDATKYSFNGRYCNAAVTINIIGVQLPVDEWGLCVPDSCGNNETYIILETLLEHFNVSQYLTVRGIECHHLPKELPMKTWAVISLVGMIALVVAVATVADVILIQIPRWKRQAQADKAYIQEDRDDDLIDNSNDEILTLLGPLSNVGDFTPGLGLRIVLAFSAWTNSQKIWNVQQPKNALSCVNGIRVLSMFWVILGHCVFFPMSVADNTMYAYNDYRSRWTFQAIMNATFSVDTFFVLSGLLVSYLTLNELKKRDGKINWFMFYFHRYLRLTPVYMMVLAIWVTTSPFWGDGPFYPQKGPEGDYCENSWWKNILYIQNFFYNEKMCMGWSWYLGADMMFFILSPFIIYPFFVRPLFGFLASAGFFIMTTATPFVLTMIHYFGPMFGTVTGHPTPDGNRGRELYMAPQCRMGPYIQGLILGFILYRCNRRMKLPWFVNITGWLLATSVALTVLYGLYDYANDQTISLVLSAFYNSLGRSAWGLSVCWVIFSCSLNGGPINMLLSLPVWIPLGRLTYTAYLVHPFLLVAFVMMRQTSFYVDDMSLIILYLAALVATYAVAFVVSLMFEAPVMGLEKIAFKKVKRT